MLIQEKSCLCLVRLLPIVLFGAFFAAFFVFVCFKKCLRCVFQAERNFRLVHTCLYPLGGVRTKKTAQLVNTNIVVRESKK